MTIFVIHNSLWRLCTTCTKRTVNKCFHYPFYKCRKILQSKSKSLLTQFFPWYTVGSISYPIKPNCRSNWLLLFSDFSELQKWYLCKNSLEHTALNDMKNGMHKAYRKVNQLNILNLELSRRWRSWYMYNVILEGSSQIREKIILVTVYIWTKNLILLFVIVNLARKDKGTNEKCHVYTCMYRIV